MPSPEGPAPTSPPADTDDLPPTQYLVLEVLAARHRLGEQLWTFPSRLTPAMRALAAAGLIGWKSGVEFGTVRAWLTDAGRAAALSESYVPPEARVHAEVAYELGAASQAAFATALTGFVAAGAYEEGRREARAQVAEEIARAIETQAGDLGVTSEGAEDFMRWAADIARQHARTEEDPDAR